jgi:hypothetical protein
MRACNQEEDEEEEAKSEDRRHENRYDMVRTKLHPWRSFLSRGFEL